MTADNQTKKVAILVEQNFEDSEFQIPYTALQEAGAEVTVLGSRMNEKYTGKQGKVSIEPDGTTTAAIFDEIEVEIAKHEQRVADLYHARTRKAKAATPTTGAAVSA